MADAFRSRPGLGLAADGRHVSDHLDYGLISSLGGLVFLYLPDMPMYHRMVLMMACAFAMTGSYALGVMSHFFPPLMMMVLAFTAILVAMVCRFYNLGSPENLSSS